MFIAPIRRLQSNVCVASQVAMCSESLSGQTCVQCSLLYFPKTHRWKELSVCPAACVGSVTCCEMSAAFGMSEKCFEEFD